MLCSFLSKTQAYYGLRARGKQNSSYITQNKNLTCETAKDTAKKIE